MNKGSKVELSCEKCGTALSGDGTSRTILADGQVHIFCQNCMQHMLIIKDGSIQL